MSDYLSLICELAAAFAGFTAVVSALDARFDGARRDLDVERLRQMLEMSLATIWGGLLPTLLILLEVAEGSPWRVAAGVMFLVILALFVVQVPRGFRRDLRAVPGYNMAYARFLTALGLAVLISFAVAALGRAASAGFYALGVSLMLMIAGLQFLRASTSFLLDRRRDRSG